MKYLLPILLYAFACAGPSARQESVRAAGPEARAYDTTYTVSGEEYGVMGARTVRIKDLNADGYLDTLVFVSGSGSGFGSSDIVLTEGKAGRRFEVSEEYCFCAFRALVYLPAGLVTGENAPFLAAVLERFPPLRAQPDPSLLWVQHGFEQERVVTGNPFVKRLIEFPDNWVEGEVKLPEAYSLMIEPADWRLTAEDYSYDDNLPTGVGEKYLLRYYAHNHYGPCGRENAPLTLVAESADYKIWSTCHALILEKAGRHKWIFMTDHVLTGGPDKLRHASIGRVQLSGQYLNFQHAADPIDFGSTIWLIDIENNICAETSINAFDYSREEVLTAFRAAQKQ